MKNRLPKTAFPGCLLIASPIWENELFRYSVCLLVHHGKDGSIGLLLNKSLPIPASALLDQIMEGAKPALLPSVHFGGPGSGQVVAIHNQIDLAEHTSGEGVYLAAHLDHLQRLVEAAESSNVRLIVGQAKWGPGELESQLRDRKWMTMPVLPQVVFADEDQMWGQAMRKIGDHFVVSITGATGQPASVHHN